MSFIERKTALADAADVLAAIDRDGHYSVQIGVDRKAGTDWPVSLVLGRVDGVYGIVTEYFGSHTDGDGEDYAEFDEAYAALVVAYDA